MQLRQPKKTFAPWRMDFKHAIQLGAIAITSGYIGCYLVYNQWNQDHFQQIPTILGLASMAIGALAFRVAMKTAKRGFYRFHGTRIEKNAITALESLLPKEWVVQRGTMCATGGDIDIILQLNKVTYAVEIKSAQSTWGCDSFFNRLFKSGIDQRAERAVAQARTNAGMVSSTAAPIVWLPLTKRFKGNYRDVLIVGGDAKYFKKVLINL